MDPKSAADSLTTMTEIILPSDSNALGTAFGGRVLQWIDICGAIAAQRHCGRIAVTASIDAVHFHAPIRVGAVANLTGTVNAAFKHSLEVGVEVHSEDPVTRVRRHCCSAFLTFTALDESFRPATVPPLLLDSPQAKQRHEEAEARRKSRLSHRKPTT